MKVPVLSLPLAVLAAPLLLTLTSCKTVYSDVYSYRKNYFDPYESREAEKSQLEVAKRDAEKARLAAMKDAQAQADRLEASGAAAPLQLDTGLGIPSSPAGMSGGSSIPGLGASPGAPSLGAIPGLDAPAAPAPSAPAMGGGDAGGAMGGAMGGTPGAAPAAPTPAKPAATTLPGL